MKKDKRTLYAVWDLDDDCIAVHYAITMVYMFKSDAFKVMNEKLIPFWEGHRRFTIKKIRVERLRGNVKEN